jgi:TatD DNase family protein
MNAGPCDAHIHLVDLLDRDPRFPEGIFFSSEARSASPWRCCAASHDEPEWERSEALRARLPPFVSSFGIHPQWAVWKNADFLARLCSEGRIAIIGEAGFDFYGDRPERVRNSENEKAQRAVFEYQLGLAERFGLPILLHLRKALDLAFAYAPRLRRLPSVVFHSYSGSLSEGEALIRKGVNAFFSFGAVILNGHKRAIEACARLPAERLLSETDAPWQPPRRLAPASDEAGAGGFCRAEDILLVDRGIAGLRSLGLERALETLRANFDKVFTR